MKKIDISDISTEKMMKIHDGGGCFLYKIESGSVLKLFTSSYLGFLNMYGVNLERRILTAKPINNVPEIVIPTAAVYSNDEFVGYTSDDVDGYDLEKYTELMSVEQKKDLNLFAILYSVIEDAIKRGTDIVFPDLCTISNIMLARGGNIRFVDYDGLQVGDEIPINISTMLGDQKQYLCPKYSRDGKYTKELDIKSLIMLYFINTFNINLNYIGKVNVATGEIITLDNVFNQLGLEDQDIKHKVWKCFQSNENNEYLGDDVFRIAEDYTLDICSHPFKANAYVKILHKK